VNNEVAYLAHLETKVDQQLKSQNVGYVLGAGASYLNGDGYPLAGQLWNCLAELIPETERSEIQAKLTEGAEGIEHALDLLDDGSVSEKTHRHLVTEAIAQHFHTISPPLECHRSFVKRLADRTELSVPIFCLNYDGLIELSADEEHVRLVDGFLGVEKPYFQPQSFNESWGIKHRARRGMQVDWRQGILHLYKLHGSLGWFQFNGAEVKRLGFGAQTPSDGKRLMVPPQHRKATDTTAPPYSALWSDFRGILCQGPNMLNRLVTIGYGLRDEHLNAVIDNAIARTNFTLLVFAKDLTPDVFERWSVKSNVIIVTSTQCSLKGEIGPGHPDLWSFETLSKRI
jgi:hypothetical protein